MLERTRDLLSLIGLGGLTHPKTPDVHGSPSASSGLYDQAADGGPYVGVKVPPPQVAGESALTPPASQHRDTHLRDAVAAAHQGVLELRRDVGAVMRELFITM